MSTHEVMFRTGSKPPDEGKGVMGGGGAVQRSSSP